MYKKIYYYNLTRADERTEYNLPKHFLSVYLIV